MPPLDVEAYLPDRRWTKLFELKPGDQSGSLSNNKPDGSRDVYIFECLPDDSGSVIYRSRAGMDIDDGSARTVFTAGADVVRELRRGDASYEMSIRTDRSRPGRIRFTHK